MAKRASTRVRGADAADGPGRLPESMAAFRRIVAAAKREPAREELLVRVCRELPRYESVVLGRRLAEVGRTPEGRLFEARLLEFVREPKVGRRYDGGLQLSHHSAWGDLVALRSRRFATMLRRWFAGADPILAAEAGKHLAWMGMEADRARVVLALREGSWRMRGEVALGLSFGAADDRLSDRFRSGAFDAIVPLLCGEAPTPRTAAAELAISSLAETLLELDRKAALEVLTSGRVLHARNLAIGGVLRQLSSARDERPRGFPAVDPGLLWPVYEAVQGGRLRFRRSENGADWKGEQVMGDCLVLAADRDPARVMRECRAILADKRFENGLPLKHSARAAIKRCRNVPEPEAVLRAHWKGRVKFRGEALKVVQAYALLEHVLSDGLPAYFDNMGDDWAGAHAGLLAIGQKEAAGIVAEGARVVMAFASPKTKGSVRAAALEMDEAATAKLERLNDRFYTHIDRVRGAVERYIAGHPEGFGSVAPKRRKGASGRG